MKKTSGPALLALWLLTGCGGGGSSPPGANNPPAAPLTVQFNNVTGTTPADAALGQPLAVEWVLPAGVSLRSVVLDATVVAGPIGSQSTCEVAGGALSATATAGTITVPNTCVSKTVKDVTLRVTVESTTGQRGTATHQFTTPANSGAFLPRRVNLPVLRITTENLAPVVSKETYINAQMTLDSNVAGTAPLASGLQIRGRGNSTWGMPKKPYRIKLTTRQALLGMPSSRDWVLLANYSDKSLLRNALALELGSRMGMPWVPRSAFVEVYLNDRYDGVYLLAENIKVATDRVNIEQLGATDADPAIITGGYLLEVDFRQDGHTMFSGVDNLPIVFQDPEAPTAPQEAYLQDFIDDFETVLHSADFANPVDRVRGLHRHRFVHPLVHRERSVPQRGCQHVEQLLDVQAARGPLVHGPAVGLRSRRRQRQLQPGFRDFRLARSRRALVRAAVPGPGVRGACAGDLEPGQDGSPAGDAPVDDHPIGCPAAVSAQQLPALAHSRDLRVAKLLDPGQLRGRGRLHAHLAYRARGVDGPAVQSLSHTLAGARAENRRAHDAGDSEQAPLGERQAAVVADDQVIEHADVDQRQGVT